MKHPVTQVAEQYGAVDLQRDKKENIKMSVSWKYKIELVDENAFDIYESKYNILICKELRRFIKEHNAASPNCDCIIINGTERVFDAVLSYNQEEKEATTFEVAFAAVHNDKFIPFANDPFGNFFCINEEECICFYDHEEGIWSETDIKLKDIEQQLY